MIRQGTTQIAKGPNSLIYQQQALLGAIVKHIKGFIRLKIALDALHRALPDATPEEIEAYDDECAICRLSLLA
ncbi:E3 ubiquitin protein ligase RIN2 [Camellia lanceoleosa]|uniref:E3 ubiquitin protein ligase RIN2 n=1 Tax=Camellia lanceoleosa TaxID=1840588 RepID=A0ACC0HWA0_9ERIC|nr:E3 ubiquitin protein ligase RIN2 [Camellia lanceoleosa]